MSATLRPISLLEVQEPTGFATSGDRKSTRLNSSHLVISYAVFCLKKKKKTDHTGLLSASEIEYDSNHILRAYRYAHSRQERIRYADTAPQLQLEHRSFVTYGPCLS